MKSFLIILILTTLGAPLLVQSQTRDSIYTDNIKTVRLYRQGNQLSFPFIQLNSGDRLQLFFDDLDARVKNYYYTFVLCNYDWTPANVMTMEYLSGFSQNRITDYRFSTVALTRYVHYQALLPMTNNGPKISGNYVLKVYLDGDTSKVVFTKRFLVVDPKAVINGQVVQPTTPGLFQQFQKVAFNIDVNGISNFDIIQQVHVNLLQNFRWDNAQIDIKPDFIRGSQLEFNSEKTGLFPAGREWRWLDIRDFHLQSDRVASADYKKSSTDIFLRPDQSLAGQPYVSYSDMDGMSLIEAVRGINPDYEGDYADVYFSFYPPDGKPFTDNDIYLFGQLTDYELSDKTKMVFDETNSVYRSHLLLKQGYYDFTYLLKDAAGRELAPMDGNNYETENAYTVLVYYRPFGSRSDRLVAISMINSNNKRQDFGR